MAKPAPWIWLAILALLAVLGTMRVSTVSLDDDNLWLAYSSVPASAEARGIEQGLHASAVPVAECDVAAFRLGLRERYAGNYAGYLAVGSGLYDVLRATGMPPEAAVIAAMMAAKALIFALVIGGLVYASARTRDAPLNAALALGLAGLAAADVIVQTGLAPSYWLADLGKPVGALTKIGYSVVLPAEANSIFAVNPRNAALGLFALAMVLRWRGLPAWGAVMVLLAGAMHQTYGGIALLLFAASAAVSDPRALAGWPVRALLTLAAVIYALRDTYFGAGLGAQLLMIAVLIGAAAGAFWFVASPLYTRLRERLLGKYADGGRYLDALVIVGICLLATAVALVAAQGAEKAQRLYLWSDLTMRIWSFARFPLFVAGAWFVAGRFRRDAAIGGTAAVLAVAAVALIDWTGSARRDAELSSALASPADYVLPRDERFIYAHLGRVAAGAETADTLRAVTDGVPRCEGVAQ